MPIERIAGAQWMLLPKEIREHLAEIFSIPRSSHTEIRDSDVITDGRTTEDLKALSLERMCEYIGSDETFARAYELTVAKAHAELHPPVGVIEGKKQEVTEIEGKGHFENGEPVNDDIKIVRRGRPAKVK